MKLRVKMTLVTGLTMAALTLGLVLAAARLLPSGPAATAGDDPRSPLIIWVVISMLLVGLGCCVGTALLFHRLIVARLAALSRQVSHIGAAGDSVRHVTADGDDEIALLARSLNSTFESLWEAQERLRHREADACRIEQQVRILSQAVEQGSSAVLITDPQGNVQYVNRRFTEITGYTAAEMLGHNPRMLKSGFHSNAFYRQMWETITAGHEWRADMCNRKKSGELYWESVSITPVRSEAGDVTHFLSVKVDITERKRTEEQLRYAALHDSLTDLPNRTLLMEHLAQSIRRNQRRPDYKFAVMFLDFDRFKVINDSLGHCVGDELLVAIARRLQACLRTTDVISGPVSDHGHVARLGGDEFVVLLDGIHDTSDAVRVAERLQEEMSAPFRLDRHEVHLTASIGLVSSDGNYERPEDILRDADTAMFHAKMGGRARHVVFDRQMHEQALQRLELENDLRRAIDEAQLFVVYQPIISLADGRVRGFEALLRWKHPQRGLIRPDLFVPISEETGLIVPIGEFVLEAACRQLAEFEHRFPELAPLSMNVNVSKRQLIQGEVIRTIRDVLNRTGIAPGALELEVTESIIMEQAEVLAPVLREIKSLGVRLAMDDFGTGHSSLSCLHRFPIDILKIDRSFIACIGTEQDRPCVEHTAIVEAIVTLAHHLGMRVVAEGIETPSQLVQLQALGCDFGQGYHFARPVPAEEALSLLAQGAWDPTPAIA